MKRYCGFNHSSHYMWFYTLPEKGETSYAYSVKKAIIFGKTGFITMNLEEFFFGHNCFPEYRK